jgi:hypothetical protein
MAEYKKDEWTEKDLAKLNRVESEYIGVADTAKLIRVQLKKNFPAVKFSVKSKSYSMGASITVRWTDGPTSKKVDEVVQVFSGANFDGMIDLKTHVQTWLLADGSATWGKSYGTEGSGGTQPAYNHPAPPEGARLVHFEADYIFTDRAYSEKTMIKAVLAVHDKFRLPLLDVKMTEWGPRLEGDLHARPNNGRYDNRDLVHQELTQMEA